MNAYWKKKKKKKNLSYQLYLSSGNRGKQNFIFKQSFYMERTYDQHISAQAIDFIFWNTTENQFGWRKPITRINNIYIYNTANNISSQFKQEPKLV